MKAILEFDLNDENDVLSHKQVFKAINVIGLLHHLQTELRSMVKYGKEGMDAGTLMNIQTMLNDGLYEWDINLEELYP